MAKSNQKGLQKNTSLQAWGKLIEKTFHRNLRIEERKDREFIYSLLEEFGLPHERFHAFKSASEISKEEFLESIGDLGLPYWISATPKLGVDDLARLSKLDIGSATDGWKFIQSLKRPDDYKVIIMQYPRDIEFKGIAIVSKSLNGVADFATGDQHVKLTAGLLMTDPMLFDSEQIYRYSNIVRNEYQDLLYSYICERPGHYEFQYGLLDKTKGISFFDYNDEPAYEDIDSLFQDLVVHFSEFKKEDSNIIQGLPASLGRAKGTCRIVLSGDSESINSVSEGDVLITDTTNPDMTPIMKKVSAIVTDLGGVTSHAAIVCRELRIPCVVGTGEATTRLKNGDVIEVDAFKGTVRIVR